MLLAKRFLVVLGLALVGCEIDDPCDANYREEHGVCIPILSDAGADGSPDGGDVDAGDDAGCPDDPYAFFGEACTRQDEPTDCPCSDYVCGALNPGEDGFCTRLGCLDDETICPPEWTCFDASAYDPRATSGVCVDL